MHPMRFSTQTNKILLFAGESRKAKMNTRKIGTVQEQRVAGWLKQHGYDIVEHNFSCRFGEIDLIARKDGYLIFVEVKYRSNRGYGSPCEAVDHRKQKRISNVAAFYLRRYGYPMDQPCRFDVAQVSADAVELMENAFAYCGNFSM